MGIDTVTKCNDMLKYHKRQLGKPHIIVLNITIIIISLTALFGCSTGSSIVTGNVRPAIDPMAVKIYLTPPAKYETIAIVESSSDVGFSSQAAQNRAIDRLKKEAAKLGANGVLLTNTANKSTGGVLIGSVFVDSDAKTARGEAIYVVQE